LVFAALRARSAQSVVEVKGILGNTTVATTRWERNLAAAEVVS